MEALENIKNYVKEKIAEHPQLKSEILDLYQLCKDQIEQGESINHECDLCQNSIDQLIDELNNPTKDELR